MTAVAPEQTLEAPIEAPVQGKTPWQLFWTRFKKDKAALMGLAMVVSSSSSRSSRPSS